jgi:hypothetical protein
MELNITEIDDIPENVGLKKLKNPKPKVSYEDILANMGMFVSNGQLHLIDRDDYAKIQTQTQSQSQNQLQPQVPITQNNNYIYNKYFKDVNQSQPTVRRPRTMQEYKRMLVEDYIQQQRIKQIKPTRLILPSSNIHFSQQRNPNKVFAFPHLQ